MIPLEIYSDPICPWCYIGWTRLARALEARPDHPFAITWKPFMLNLGMPKCGMDRAEYLEAKFGGQMGAVKAYAPVLEAAEAEGLGIDFAAIKRTPNTLDAHRLIHWAGLEGRQTPVATGLFRAYFAEARDIGEAQVLADVGARAGMDREMILRLLATDADKDTVLAQDKAARDMGITAIPTFIIAGRHVLNGAVTREKWQEVIDALAPADPPAVGARAPGGRNPSGSSAPP